jgi:flagellar biosynthesis protein
MNTPPHQPPKIAVALEYDGHTAPRVTAKGKGPIAEEIIAIAQRHDIPLQDQPELVQLLGHVALGEEIPRQLYVAVAEVIAFTRLLKQSL